MELFTYFCDKCKRPYCVSPNDDNEEGICTQCGGRMRYCITEEYDPETNKVINSYIDRSRKIKNPTRPTSSEFAHLEIRTVTCPYCKSTNTKKISGTSKVLHGLFFGVHAIGRNAKEWHCNTCNSDF